MTQEELQQLVHGKMNGALNKLVSETSAKLVDAIGKAFEEGINVGIEIGKSLEKK